MNIFQFLRIFWARRVMILSAMFSCLAGALVVMLILPPRWTGTARSILEVLKPDPVTGVVLGRDAITYINAQKALVTDYSVVGRVADQLGWMSDPTLIQQYRKRPSSDTRDFRHWLAYNVIQRTSANVVQGTNILEINYSSAKPDDARAVADALRRSYMDVTTNISRDEATRNAQWYADQANKARADLNTAQAAVAAFERSHGVAMADDKTDVDTARLRTLASQGALEPTPPPPAEASPVQVELAQIDGELAQALKTLGPNHPDVQALRAKRASLAALAATEASKRSGEMAKARAETASAVQTAMQQAKAKVVGEKSSLDELSRLQQEVLLRQAQFDKTQAKAVDLQQQAAVTGSAITPLGPATIPPQPDFPNPLLIVAGGIVLGLGMGLVVALITELLARRVRAADDLVSAVDAPMLAVISGPAKAPRTQARLGRPVAWPAGRKAV